MYTTDVSQNPNQYDTEETNLRPPSPRSSTSSITSQKQSSDVINKIIQGNYIQEKLEPHSHSTKSKPLTKKIITFLIRYSSVMIFLFMITLDEFFMLSYYYLYFEKYTERQGYFYIALILYSYIIIIYLKIVLGTPSQTSIEDLQSKYPNRILPKKITDDYSGFCQFCNKKKNIRSSHCSTCKICVIKRDHHCPWVNKCVGYKNINYFVSYLLWMLIYGVLYFLGFIKYYNNCESRKFLLMGLMIFCTLFSLFVFFGVSNLLITNIINFINDISFYETTKKANLEKYFGFFNKEDMENYSYNKYNKGWFLNLRACVGPTIFHLFFPLLKEINNDIDENKIVFYQNKHARKYDVIKELSGKVYGSLDSIMAGQYNISDPNKSLVASREYGKPDIKVI